MNDDLAVRSRSSELIAAEGARPLALSELALERGEKLPRDHPRAPHDAIALSSRARDLVAGQKNNEIVPLTFWEHPARTAPIGPRRVSIDASASYKLE